MCFIGVRLNSAGLLPSRRRVGRPWVKDLNFSPRCSICHLLSLSHVASHFVQFSLRISEVNSSMLTWFKKMSSCKWHIAKLLSTSGAVLMPSPLFLILYLSVSPSPPSLTRLGYECNAPERRTRVKLKDLWSWSWTFHRIIWCVLTRLLKQDYPYLPGVPLLPEYFLHKLLYG